MKPLGRDMLDVLPFRDPQVCDRVRAIAASEITRREPAHHPDFRLRVIGDAASLHQALADDMFNRMAEAARVGESFVGIFPVGPTGQYPLLAKRINETRLPCDHVHLFFLDEYAYEDGRTIDKFSPWSFERTARDLLLDRLDPRLSIPPGQVHFPGPDNADHYDELIAQTTQGRGADIVYGGVGWSGHFAFWDPHLWDEFGGDLEAWKAAHTSYVRLHPMTILHNSLRAGGDWSSIPPCAYTIGPSVLLSARYRSFWLTAALGGGMSWQRFVGRLATHGPVTPLIPASFLQTAPGEVVFLSDIADNIGGPKTQWQ